MTAGEHSSCRWQVLQQQWIDAMATINWWEAMLQGGQLGPENGTINPEGNNSGSKTGASRTHAAVLICTTCTHSLKLVAPGGTMKLLWTKLDRRPHRGHSIMVTGVVKSLMQALQSAWQQRRGTASLEYLRCRSAQASNPYSSDILSEKVDHNHA